MADEKATNTSTTTTGKKGGQGDSWVQKHKVALIGSGIAVGLVILLIWKNYHSSSTTSSAGNTASTALSGYPYTTPGYNYQQPTGYNGGPAGPQGPPGPAGSSTPLKSFWLTVNPKLGKYGKEFVDPITGGVGYYYKKVEGTGKNRHTVWAWHQANPHTTSKS